MKTAAAIIATANSANGPEKTAARLRTRPAATAGSTSPAWLARVPYQGILPAKFSHLGRANRRDPCRQGRATQEH